MCMLITCMYAMDMLVLSLNCVFYTWRDIAGTICLVIQYSVFMQIQTAKLPIPV